MSTDELANFIQTLAEVSPLANSATAGARAQQIPKTYADPAYFGYARSNHDPHGRQADFVLLTRHPENIHEFMRVIFNRFQKLTEGYTIHGRPVIKVKLVYGQKQNIYSKCHLVLSCKAIGRYMYDYSDIILRFDNAWAFLEQLYRKALKTAFALGTHVRVGAQSSVRRATQHDLYERRVFGLVFQYVGSVTK